MTTARRHIVIGIVLVVGVIGASYGIAQLFSSLHLVGTTWELRHYGDPQHLAPALAHTRPTLAFGPATLDGWAGCNDFRDGSFLAVGSALWLAPGGITETACGSEAEQQPGEIMEQETVYLDLLYQVDTFTRDGDTLTLHTPNGILVFQRRD